MPIFVGFNLFLPLFPLGLSPLGTSVKQTNLVKETGDLNNSPKINAVAVSDLLLILVFLAALWYTLNRLTNLILTYNT